MNKYRNKKTVHRSIKFDSIAEAEYYDLALWQAEANGWKVKLQERFELMPKFELDGKKYRKIEYIPDFTFYKNGKLVKVVDVKGMQTKDFKIKAKLFCHQYQVPLILAKKISEYVQGRAFLTRWSIMTTEEVIQMRIRSLQREIDDLERTKAVMVNETARKAIDLHIENLRREIRRLEE